MKAKDIPNRPWLQAISTLKNQIPLCCTVNPGEVYCLHKCMAVKNSLVDSIPSNSNEQSCHRSLLGQGILLEEERALVEGTSL